MRPLLGEQEAERLLDGNFRVNDEVGFLLAS